MLLLNVSDIHFNHPACNSLMDADRPFRTRLIQDARARVADLGPVGAILVSGDIAYRSLKKEYEAAYAWLTELAHSCGCPLERVYVIPGNHDVDRSVTRTDQSVINVHRAIVAASSAGREQELRAQFVHPETGRALMNPISEYNEFAARFSCQVYTPEKLFWHQDLPLDQDTTLRIYGLTSTLISGAGGENDRKGHLYLSPLQTVLDPVDSVVNLVMCHHPPDWLLDHDEVDDAVNGRAMLQFFGHKHRTRIHRDRHFVRFSAGAVNPDRNEPGWEPGYNFVKLTLSDEGGDRHLDIEAHLLVWQTNPDLFRPKLDVNNETVHRHRMTLPRIPRRDTQLTIESVATSAVVPLQLGPSDVAEKETAMSDRDTRNLILRFWDLASSARREIALELGLIEMDEITKLPEPERYGRALSRAGERGLLERVAEEIEKREEH
jgi:predicted MPP superfamily phosphohydrolase